LNDEDRNKQEAGTSSAIDESKEAPEAKNGKFFACACCSLLGLVVSPFALIVLLI